MEELSKEVINYLAKKYGKVKKGIGDIMCGPMIETEVDRLVKSERSRAAKAEDALYETNNELIKTKQECEKLKAEIARLRAAQSTH